MSSDPRISNGKPIRPALSEEEQARRCKAVETARVSSQLSGFEPDPEAEALNARYITGEQGAGTASRSGGFLSWFSHET